MFATSREKGSTLVLVLVLTVTMAGLSLVLVTSSMASYRATRARFEGTKAFYVAEGGVDWALSQLRTDPYLAASSTSFFPEVVSDGKFRSAWMPLGEGGGEFRATVTYTESNPLPDDWDEVGFPDGFEKYVPVSFTLRTDTPHFDRLHVSSEGRVSTEVRFVSANVKLEVTMFKGALVSDAQSIAGTGSGKSYGIANHAVVFNGVDQYVYGGLTANGGAYIGDSDTPLTLANAASIGGWDGEVSLGLYGTVKEIPDYTTPGSEDQLFDFGQFEAAALAGAGHHYASLDDFAAGMNAANDAGVPLEGIIWVTLDCAALGAGPHIRDNPSGDVEIPLGINILGTMVFHFENAPVGFYKIFIEVPVNVNPAPLDPLTFDPTDSSTFSTGYPPVISEDKDPRGFEMGSEVYEDFPVDADLPAVMFDNCTVDFHYATNICGVIYGPAFIEFENKKASLQYVNGMILGGAGIYVEGKSGPGSAQVFVFDENTVDDLATFEYRGKTPIISEYVIDR